MKINKTKHLSLSLPLSVILKWLVPIVLISTACQFASGAVEPVMTIDANQPTSISSNQQPVPPGQPSNPTLPPIYTVPQAQMRPVLNPLNATAEAGQWTIAVLGWGVLDVIGPNQPDPGMKLLAVDIVYLNRGSDWGFTNGSETRIRDLDTGQDYSISPFYYPGEDDGVILSAGFSPGEHGRLLLIFQVPENSSRFAFVFTPGSFGAGTEYLATIPLEQEGTPGSLPAEMLTYDPGAQAVDGWVTVGDLAVAVTGWHEEAVQDASTGNASGLRLLTIEMQVSNLSGDFAFGNDSGDFTLRLKDTTGLYFFPDYAAGRTTIGAFPQQDQILLSPLESAHIRSFFFVPESAVELELFIDYKGPHQRFASDPSYPARSGRSFVSLGQQPVDVGLAGNMPGSLAPDLIPMGESAKLNPFTITVTDAIQEDKPGGGFNIQAAGTQLTVKYRLAYSGVPPQGYPPEMTTTPNTINRFVKCGEGNYYHSVFGAYNDVPLSAGSVVDLETTFFVPADSGDCFLVFGYSFSTEKLFMALK